MNILQAYINQFSKLNIIFLSVDYDLLRNLVYNLSKDFKADIIDLFPIMDDLNNIDSKKINNMNTTSSIGVRSIFASSSDLRPAIFFIFHLLLLLFY